MEKAFSISWQTLIHTLKRLVKKYLICAVVNLSKQRFVMRCLDVFQAILNLHISQSAHFPLDGKSSVTLT